MIISPPAITQKTSSIDRGKQSRKPSILCIRSRCSFCQPQHRHVKIEKKKKISANTDIIWSKAEWFYRIRANVKLEPAQQATMEKGNISTGKLNFKYVSDFWPQFAVYVNFFRTEKMSLRIILESQFKNTLSCRDFGGSVLWLGKCTGEGRNLWSSIWRLVPIRTPHIAVSPPPPPLSLAGCLLRTCLQGTSKPMYHEEFFKEHHTSV